MKTRSKSHTNFNCLPLEIQLRILSMLPTETTVTTSIDYQSFYTDENYPRLIRQDYSSLAVTTLVSKKWNKLGEHPKLWEHFNLLINSNKTPDDILAALRTTRFQRIKYMQFMYCLGLVDINRNGI